MNELIADQTKRIDVFIPNERMGEFKRKIEVIQAQARKLDLPLWDVVVGDKEWRSVNLYPVDLYPGRIAASPLQIEGCSVSIVGQAPVLAGWRFLAKIEHGEGGNLVKRMVGGDSSPAEWHSCGPNCAHCSVSRARKNTYMLESVDTGEVKQVGSTCVSDFLGKEMRDPDRIAAMFDHLMALEDEFEYDPDKEFTGCSMGSYGVAPAMLMATVLKIVQEDGGYFSADKAESLHCLKTGDRLRDAIWASKPTTVVRPDAGHVEQATRVVSWLTEQKAVDSLWLRNIAYLADRTCITMKDAGLFASGYVAWNRDLQKNLRAERGSGDWVGSAGEKITTAATLERRAGYENAYGYVTVLSFRDEEGNGLIWKTSAPPSGLVVGSTYRVAATVKAHGDYKGDKQTEIIRAKVAELELFSLGPLPGFKKVAALASPDVCDESGHSPLLKAVWGDKIPHALVLLSNGADANQLNQREVPILAYAVSPEMAKVLLDAGARAVDVSGKWLDGMTADAKAIVVAAMPVIDGSGELDGKRVIGQDGLDVENDGTVGGGFPVPLRPSNLKSLSLADVTVSEGRYFGKILSVADNIAVQKINREGTCVQHDLAKLSVQVKENDVVNILYKDGQGVVSGLNKGVGVGL